MLFNTTINTFYLWLYGVRHNYRSSVCISVGYVCECLSVAGVEVVRQLVYVISDGFRSLNQ